MDSRYVTNAKKYCWIAGLSLFVVMSGVLAFNCIVDPYGMYRLIEVKGFNSHKPAIYNRVRLFKAYDVRRIKPSAIVLGTSRSHVGLRMSHEGWAPTVTPRYNLSFDGATTEEMYFYLSTPTRFTRSSRSSLGLISISQRFLRPVHGQISIPNFSWKTVPSYRSYV